MNPSDIVLFIAGVIFVEYFCRDILNALFQVGKSKGNVKKIKKGYSWWQIYCCKYITFPSTYNRKTVKFFWEFRKIHFVITVLMLIAIIISSSLNQTSWLGPMIYCKTFTIDLFMLIYLIKHGAVKLFERSVGKYDFTKKP